METCADIWSRAKALLGDDGMSSLQRMRVIVFGVGGVGSWCAEALIRSGVGHLTLVDPDVVCYSNINRQLPATLSTIGRAKVEVLRERFLSINPEAEIIARQEAYTAYTAHLFDLSSYDYVIDAIDSLRDKAELILNTLMVKEEVSMNPEVCNDVKRGSISSPVLLSSMGAARKFDPTKVQVAEFWKIEGDPLARALRKWFKHAERYPERKFRCVYSTELSNDSNQSSDSAPLKGSLMPVTATFGLVLASLIINSK